MRKNLLPAMALALATPLSAVASCGAAFCSVNTSWDVQDAWSEPGLRLDLRYEYIPQDQPMSGDRRVAVGMAHRHRSGAGYSRKALESKPWMDFAED